MTLNDLVKGTQGELKSQRAVDFLEIVTDSRKDVRGKIFIALKGETHDGHQFLKQVVEKGAAAVVSHDWKPEYAELLQQTTWIQVPDTLKALQSLAQFWRRKWGKKILAITGSNGKTSVKDFTATLLSKQFCVLKNEGSFNNHWGLPLTFLELKPEHELAVVEMGMNHAGEITKLCQIGEPNIVAVNNVGRAHIENFGTVEGIAKAKAEIYQGAAAPKSEAAFNLADAHTVQMYERFKNNFINSDHFWNSPGRYLL
jgi:UDP-N-acetylmuramoyl-tripeptide--D-alanyl-D-alanine ligase